MARFVAGAVFGIVVGTVLGAATGLHADEANAQVRAAAAVGGVDEQDLAGAVNTLQIDPWVYLRSEGLLERAPAPPPPFTVPFNARVACIESKESGGANVANRRGSGAVGVMQYMPSTFYAHAAEMGHFNWSPWNPDQARAVAAHDLALGRRAQWTVSGC